MVFIFRLLRKSKQLSLVLVEPSEGLDRSKPSRANQLKISQIIKIRDLLILHLRYKLLSYGLVERSKTLNRQG